MATSPLTLTRPDRELLQQIVASRSRRGEAAATWRSLSDELQSAHVIGPGDAPRTLVTLNSRVRVRRLGTDVSRELILVVPGMADLQRGRLSVVTPVGRALLGRSEGEVITCDAPAGTVQYVIEAVLYQPETAGAS